MIGTSHLRRPRAAKKPVPPAAPPAAPAAATPAPVPADAHADVEADGPGVPEALVTRVRRTEDGWAVELPHLGLSLPVPDAESVGAALGDVLAGALLRGEADVADVVLTFHRGSSTGA
ncbi:hypothetical protein [Nocardioides sp. GY 10127]|uniref:hypothetical protein n=1 Tax=Nocardioides sp. GY 10127 TaxID=2569762 RepID=UPI0010A8E253|nr:hypothetical protein [Nocardioides sp. GY 10127]TIC79356.1 hypothetical protein E8D37_17335 [Nocardioides sp. GY 10127]